MLPERDPCVEPACQAGPKRLGHEAHRGHCIDNSSKRRNVSQNVIGKAQHLLPVPPTTKSKEIEDECCCTKSITQQIKKDGGWFFEPSEKLYID
jgi:hypothetical protein